VDAAPVAVALLLAFGAAEAVRVATGISSHLVVFTVVVALQVSQRGRGGTWFAQVLQVLMLPAIALLTAELAQLMLSERTIADAVVVIAMFLAIASRDAPAPWANVGRMLRLPIIALFVTPIPVSALHAQNRAWYPALATLAGVCALVAGWFLAPAAAGRRPPPSAGSRRPSRMRPSPTLRVALHASVALALAFAIAQHFFVHWAWAVVSVLAISGGLASRGAVLVRGAERLVGALAGTVAATLLADAVGADARLAVAVILLLLVTGVVLRTVSYAYWAFCVTALLALLYGLYGERGTQLLGERLAQNVIGALCVLVPACLLLPIPTSAVVRARAAAALGALGVLSDAIESGAPRERLLALEREAQARTHELHAASQPLRIARRLRLERDAIARALGLADRVTARESATYALLAGDRLADTELTPSRSPRPRPARAR
jgi:uncharacterized membrane protein YccC